MKKRFTILKHQTDDSIHVDFLLENDGEKLWTWRIDEIDDFIQKKGKFTVSAKRIFDHRKIYLDFEGEIGGNRGLVTIIDTGHWFLLHQDDSKIDFRTESSFFIGLWQFHFPENFPGFPAPELGIWTLSRMATEAAC